MTTPASATADTYVPIGRITRSTDHQYTFDGRTYPGVTNILKTIDKSFVLMTWAARQTAEAALDLMMKKDGEDSNALQYLLDTVGRAGTIKAITARSDWKRDEAADLGTLVHSLADDLINGRPTEVPEHAKKHVANYREWWEASGWTLRTSEAYLINPHHGYGGTLDLLCKDRDGRTVLADIKTGKGVYSEAVLQLTAYGDSVFIQPPGQPVFTMPAIDRYAILHVTADGVREIEIPVGTLERMAWAGCMDLYEWHRTVKGKRL